MAASWAREYSTPVRMKAAPTKHWPSEKPCKERKALQSVVLAMKVLMHVNSPLTATVKEILIAPLDHIEAGDLLIVFE